MPKAWLARRCLEYIHRMASVSRCRDVALITCLAAAAHAGPPPFDLAGPVLEVRVTRGAQTLPIFEVPNLSVGDQVWIKADLPLPDASYAHPRLL